MNKTMIDWCDYSWNPVTGCNNGCFYCYARKIYHRFGRSFKPRFHPDRLNEIDRIKKPSRIFLGSVTDLWDPMVKPEWREKIFDKCLNMTWPTIRHHQFIALTKQPQNIEYSITISSHKNLWVGVSIESIPHIDRWVALSQKEYILNKIISFEPVLGYFDDESYAFHDLKVYFNRYGYPDWLIIGALTGMNKEECYDSRRESESLINKLLELPNRPPIFVKDNVMMKNPPREFPKEMMIANH
ncbi:MAG: DUF5131 family protein [Planctomycetota bacterium]